MSISTSRILSLSLVWTKSEILKLSPPPLPDTALSDIEDGFDSDLFRAVRMTFSFFALDADKGGWGADCEGEDGVTDSDFTRVDVSYG